MSLGQSKRTEVTELFMLMVRRHVMRQSFLEGGVEYEWFRQLRDPTPPGAEDDFRGLVLSAQLTNVSDYQGYRLSTVLGLEVARRSREAEGTLTSTRGFVTVYAGLGE